MKDLWVLYRPEHRGGLFEARLCTRGPKGIEHTTHAVKFKTERAAKESMGDSGRWTPRAPNDSPEVLGSWG